MSDRQRMFWKVLAFVVMFCAGILIGSGMEIQ